MELNKKYTMEDIKGLFVGSYFGDGGFVKKGVNHNTYVVFKHSADQYEYLNWKYELLRDFWMVNDHVIIKEQKLCGCFANAQKQYTFRTKSMRELNIFKEKNKMELLDMFNKMALAVFVLDDGSRDKHRWTIGCGTLSSEEKQYFTQIMDNKFRINCTVYSHPTNSVKDKFCITTDYDKIDKIILRNIPNDIDIIRRKIYGNFN